MRARSARQVRTEHGPARVHEYGSGTRLLVLGHGAGGGVDARDLQAVAAAVSGAQWTVVLVEQPYRVAGRRAPAPAGRLDDAFTTVVAALRGSAPVLVTGGRSSGARVACRTAAAARADAVVALGFPLRPPSRGTDRGAELLAVQVPVLVVQGERDSFGRPADLPALGGASQVHAVAGADHAFRARRVDGRGSQDCAQEVGAVVRSWLQATLT